MEKINELSQYLEETTRKLSGEELSQIDFDQLTTVLKQISKTIRQSTELNDGYELLRDDYIARIGGMVKAIAVVSKKQNLLEESKDLIESLSQLDAAELIKTYRRVQSRFQDSFPASFGHLRKGQNNLQTNKIEQFK